MWSWSAARLSAATQAEIEVEAFADGHDLHVTLTRAKFESLNAASFDACLDTAPRPVETAGVVVAALLSPSSAGRDRWLRASPHTLAGPQSR